MKENVCGLLLKKIASIITLSLSTFLLIASVFLVGCEENIDDEEIKSEYNLKDLEEFYLKSKFGDHASIFFRTRERFCVDVYYFTAIRLEHGVILLYNKKAMTFIPEENILSSNKDNNNNDINFFHVSNSSMSRR